jgi:hypothetical protein
MAPRIVALGALAAVGSLAASLLLVTGTQSANQRSAETGLTISLLGHNVSLTNGYRKDSNSQSSCESWLSATKGDVTSWAFPAAVDDGGVPNANARGSSNVVTAPGDQQGCIQSSITAPYTLPPGVTETSPIIPEGSGSSPTSVDGFYAETDPVEVQATNPDGAVTTVTGTLLYVRVAASGGQFQLVTVVGWEIPASEVVSLTSQAIANLPN